MSEDTIDLNDTVRVLGSKAVGTVRGIHIWADADVTFTVAYTDSSGNPQKREWSWTELQLIEKAPAAAEVVDPTSDENVIPFARAN